MHLDGFNPHPTGEVECNSTVGHTLMFLPKEAIYLGTSETLFRCQCTMYIFSHRGGKAEMTVYTRTTTCNRCQLTILCYWLRRGIGNCWLCEPCSRTAYPRKEVKR